MTHTVLHIDSSARVEDSASRALTAQIVAQLKPETVLRRDVATPLPLLDAAWVAANLTPADARSDAQKETLALSDSLVTELQQADTIVIGAPMYNFSIPAALKVWIDQVCRAGMTFSYTEAGPKGLLEGKRAIVVITSGGVPVGSDYDYASAYVRHVLGFIGITEVEFIVADQQAIDQEASMTKAKAAIAALAA